MGSKCAYRPRWPAHKTTVLNGGLVWGRARGLRWFITNGVLEVVDESLPVGDDVIVALHKGDYVGEFALLAADPTKARRSSSLRTQGYVELYTLHRDDFVEVITLVPEVRVPSPWVVSCGCAGHARTAVQGRRA